MNILKQVSLSSSSKQVVLLLALTTLMLFSSNSRANSEDVFSLYTLEEKEEYLELQEEADKINLAISMMEENLNVVDNQIILDKKGLNKTIRQYSWRQVNIPSKDVFQSLEAALEVTNEELLTGKLSIDEVDLGKDSSNSTKQDSKSLLCAGQNKTVRTWWGYWAYLDSCYTGAIVNFLYGSAGAYTFCAAVALTLGWTGIGAAIGTACGLLGGLYAISASYVGISHDLCGQQGLKFQMLFTVPTTYNKCQWQ